MWIRKKNWFIQKYLWKNWNLNSKACFFFRWTIETNIISFWNQFPSFLYHSFWFLNEMNEIFHQKFQSTLQRILKQTFFNFPLHMNICESGYTLYDDFELSPVCIAESALLGVRASVFVLQIIVLIGSIVYLIKFKESTIHLFHPSEWKDVHVSHVLSLEIGLYGKFTISERFFFFFFKIYSNWIMELRFKCKSKRFVQILFEKRKKKKIDFRSKFSKCAKNIFIDDIFFLYSFLQ